MKKYTTNPINWSKATSFLLTTIVLVTFTSSCKEYLDTDLPPSKIPSELVFSDESTATAAVLGIYQQMYFTGQFASGDQLSVMTLAGLSSDELVHFTKKDPLLVQFETNDLLPDNSYLERLWSSIYKVMYQVNAVIEGLTKAENLSKSAKQQLKGEALFVGAFCNFYLVNMFGDVPLVNSTDYRQNSRVSRTPSDEIYAHIQSDLEEAIELLDNVKITNERVRPGKYAAMAMLARVNLFIRDWPNAEKYASLVLANTSDYYLENLDDVFLTTSHEAIWQLKPIGSGSSYTNEGYYFKLSNALQYNVLAKQIMDDFETGDKRLNKWTLTEDADNEPVYLPYKYKVSTPGKLTEYSMVLRLAEQYLIRAEARAEQGNLTGAAADLNVVRDRAGLPGIVASSKEALLDQILHERKVELFTEWGHRWFDLKRTGNADRVLGLAKQNWKPEDALYPMPQRDLDQNPNLSQNPGY